MSSGEAKWSTFAAGILLGSAIATGSAFLALRYKHVLLPSNGGLDDDQDGHKAASKKRNNRAQSPSMRHMSYGSKRSIASNEANGGSHLSRSETERYYETPGRDIVINTRGALGTPLTPADTSRPVMPHPSPMSPGIGKPTSGARYNGVNGHQGRPGLVRQDTMSESDAMTTSASPHSQPVLYAGPADRANPAVHEALLHTTFIPSGHMQWHPAAPLPSPPLVPQGVPGALGHTSSLATPSHGVGPHMNGGAHHQLIPGQLTVAPSAAATGGHQQASVTTADALATEGRIIEDAALHEQYSRVILPEPTGTEETEEVCWMLQRALDIRKKWLFNPVSSPESWANHPEATRMSECIGGDPFGWTQEPPAPYRAEMVDGVMAVFDQRTGEQRFKPPGSATDFFSDMHWLLKVSSVGHMRSFTHSRLQLLEQKFNLHVMLNADKEFLAQKSAPHRDFYNVRKVDTHVHHSACMHQKHLLRFIKSKLKKEGDEVVIFRDGKYLTLKEVFESLNLTPYELSVDTLDVHADKNIFHRFDKFNLKYNPFGQSRLREVFIKQDNLIHGRYLAELTREVFNDLEASKYQHTEYRISVYGRKPGEWDTLAAWVVQNRLYSDNNVWMIQVPRLYNVYKEQGIVENFQQLLDNIFIPLFDATINPSEHAMLHIFLRHISGFDLVDDESKPERRPNKHMPTPAEWTSKHNPAYAYYAYYMYANLYVLNRLREDRGFNTFALRPHAGEAGDLDHLASTFLAAENIAHGINLRKSPCLQYLYYAAQVGLCMSPLSNNSLFLDYHKNPFPQFFARGLSGACPLLFFCLPRCIFVCSCLLLCSKSNMYSPFLMCAVSLSTDDPLQIHLTREPLVEEYSVAAQVWKLSGTDLCEVARNSVVHSGFPPRLKMHWIHTEYWRLGPEGNNIQKTNVPALRMIFRRDCLLGELGLLSAGSMAHAARLRAKELHNAQD